MSLCCLWTPRFRRRDASFEIESWAYGEKKLTNSVKKRVKSQGQACSSGCCGTCTILTTRLNLTLIGKMYHKSMTKSITVGNDWIRLEKWEKCIPWVVSLLFSWMPGNRTGLTAIKGGQNNWGFCYVFCNYTMLFYYIFGQIRATSATSPKLNLKLTTYPVMLISEHQQKQQQQHSDIFVEEQKRRAGLSQDFWGWCLKLERFLWRCQKKTFGAPKSFVPPRKPLVGPKVFSIKMNDRNSSVKERLFCTWTRRIWQTGSISTGGSFIILLKIGTSELFWLGKGSFKGCTFKGWWKKTFEVPQSFLGQKTFEAPVSFFLGRLQVCEQLFDDGLPRCRAHTHTHTSPTRPPDLDNFFFQP